MKEAEGTMEESRVQLSFLEIAPLCADVCGKIKNDEVSLDESMDLLVCASDLITGKSRWLLPFSGLNDEVAATCDEGSPDEPMDSDEESPPEFFEPPGITMTKEELGFAVEALRERLEHSSRMLPRGFFVSTEGASENTVSYDPSLLRDAMMGLSSDSQKKPGVLFIPRWNFVKRLKELWTEIRRASSRALVLRFSWFRGKEKRESILNFLVFLELVKRGRLFAVQKEVAGDILFSTKREALLVLESDGPNDTGGESSALHLS